MKTTSAFLVSVLLSGPIFAQTGSRLTSIADWRYDGSVFQPIDSDCYYTSGNHICDLNLGFQNDSFSLNQYSSTTHSFTPVRKTYNVLDASGRIVSTLEQDIVNNVLADHILFNYNYSNPFVTIDTSKIWNTSTQSWDNLYLTVDSSSSAHLQVLWQTKAWYAPLNLWINFTQTVTTYTSFNKPATVYNYVWNANTNSWDNNTRHIYSYSSSNKLLIDETHLWNTNSNSWVKLQQLASTYSISGDTIDVVHFSWDNATQNWLPQARELQEFDNQGNLIVNTGQNWSGITGGFENTSRVKQTYNTYNQLLSHTEETWNPTTGIWENDFGNNNAYYHYEQYATTGIPNKPGEAPQFSIYPIPSNETLWLKWDGTQVEPVTITISDLQGRNLYTERTISRSIHEAIPLQSLAAGAYILQLSCNGKTSARQFQVVR